MARGKIEIGHTDLVDLLIESADWEFDRKYFEAVIANADRDEIEYYKELIEEREARLTKTEPITEERLRSECESIIDQVGGKK